MRTITLLIVLVALADAADPIARFNAVLDDLIKRTDKIVVTTEGEVFRDLDRVQAELRKRTLGTRVTGDITVTNLANRRTINGLVQRTLTAIVKAEKDFDNIYQGARAQIRRENSGTVLEPFIRNALNRIDQIVQRTIKRINELAESSRAFVIQLSEDSAAQLQWLHDQALAARPRNDAYYQQLLEAGVDPAQAKLRTSMQRTKNDINEAVQQAETEVRREADPTWAATHPNQ